MPGFVPRSVAGTKRPHAHRCAPQPVPPSASVDPTVEQIEGAAPLAAVLMNWVSPWWCAQRTDPLATMVNDAVKAGTPIHAARIVACAGAHALGCTSVHDVAAALRHLAPLGAVECQVAFHAPCQPSTVFIENAVEHASDALTIATSLLAVLHSTPRPHGGQPRIYAVYPPSEYGTAPAVPPTTCMKHAFVVLDPDAAQTLTRFWGWDTPRDWLPKQVPAAVAHAVYHHLRCLPIHRWKILVDEYIAWHRDLVLQNTEAAKARAARASISLQLYPLHTIVALAMGPHERTQAAYKAALARLLPNGVDYVEMDAGQACVFVRCATGAAAARLVTLTWG
ncbi:hypothetical protein MVES1_003496 [Malassezia vespertilionis]|uniref:Uncharacterized protein n=1 Tax=Malassezia vespertilionis TaxID=2020962 RepID=A0A2N1J723_9BASI|nr:uncharacterized protein MVES1_003496 [Malassezia vespertilionis]PKI82351.1 hypothetical protein MVES_003733 [Malassezia vespertilionis]WFD08126.1 hypothetical protein MVES1_003496 [Malassezia vespertilionis]